MKLSRWMSLVFALGLVCSASTYAAQISYISTPLGASSWRYDYTVTNDNLPAGIGEFTVYFSRATSSQLSVVASPLGWDSLVAQPNNGTGEDGFFDSLRSGAPLALSQSAGIFAVRFNYLGPGVSGPQLFDIVDPGTFSTIQSGFTVAAVPEPSTALLVAMGCGLLLALRKRATR